MMTKNTYIFVAMFFSMALWGQEAPNLAIGDWELLLPYNQVVSVTHNGEKVYFASKYSIVSRDKTDGSLEFFDLVSGLSETGIRFIKYDRQSDGLFVIYENSNIDYLKGGDILNLPIIMNKQIIGDKFIYDLSFSGNTAYMSCGFGLVALNTSTLDVYFSMFTEKPVKGVGVIDDQLYASVKDGVYQIAKNHTNIQDFSNWKKLDGAVGFPSDFSASFLVALGKQLIFGANNRLLRYDVESMAVDTIFEGVDQHLVKLTQEGEGIVATFFCDGPGEWDDCDGKLVYIAPSGNIKVIGSSDTRRPIDGIQDGNDIWVGDQWYPYRRISLDGGHEKVFTVNSPFSARGFKTKVVDDQLYVLAGTWSPTKSFPGLVVIDGLFIRDLKDGQWSYVNRITNPSLVAAKADYNFMDMEIHPLTNKKYVALFGGGIIEIEGENVKVFNKDNSSLKPEPGYETRVSVIDLAFDTDNNLWATNYSASKPLAVLKNDGSWQSFDLGSSNTATNRIMIDDYGNKWIIIVSKGLLVFNSGTSLNDVSDDQYKLFNSSNSALKVNNVNDVAQDLDGSVWVATDEGVVTFECGGDVFSDFCKGSRRIAALDGFNARLLEDEKVNVIGIDGANRKWFGTTNGVFVLSSSGEEVINTFNVDNSPLPNNDIQSLSIDDKTGTVYIGTSFGLASYRSDAVAGNSFHKPEVFAYPNPVTPDYTGPIAIKGLAKNANIKITDVEGRLVYETEALGGQAIWDGRDYNHRKVESGVYLVFSTSVPGLTVDAAVAKIVVIN